MIREEGKMKMSTMDIFSRKTTTRPTRVSGLVGELTQRFARYKTYRRTLEELEALSDRELTDLGLSRSMTRSIAYKAAYGG